MIVLWRPLYRENRKNIKKISLVQIENMTENVTENMAELTKDLNK
jgi:hypothetical protein